MQADVLVLAPDDLLGFHEFTNDIRCVWCVVWCVCGVVWCVYITLSMKLYTDSHLCPPSCPIT